LLGGRDSRTWETGSRLATSVTSPPRRAPHLGRGQQCRQPRELRARAARSPLQCLLVWARDTEALSLFAPRGFVFRWEFGHCEPGCDHGGRKILRPVALHFGQFWASHFV